MRILVAYDGSPSSDTAIEGLRRAGLPKQAEVLVVSVADSDELFHSQSSLKHADAQTIAANAAGRIKSYFPEWNVSSITPNGSPGNVLADVTGWWHPELVVIGSHGRSAVRRLFLGSVSWEVIHKAACSVRVVREGGTPKLNDPIRIVIGIDGSKESATALSSVVGRPWPEKTEVHIVSAVQTLAPTVTALDASTFAQEPAYSVIRTADERLRFRIESIAAESANALRRAGLIATTHVVEGDPREAILTVAEVSKADAIFVGARGLGPMQRLLLGSVSSYVVTHAHCSVEVVRFKSAQ
jgi:nucleotide-binding universal stress UspA family protein